MEATVIKLHQSRRPRNGELLRICRVASGVCVYTLDLTCHIKPMVGDLYVLDPADLAGQSFMVRPEMVEYFGHIDNLHKFMRLEGKDPGWFYLERFCGCTLSAHRLV
jgi:hypothetical protein